MNRWSIKGSLGKLNRWSVKGPCDIWTDGLFRVLMIPDPCRRLTKWDGSEVERHIYASVCCCRVRQWGCPASFPRDWAGRRWRTCWKRQSNSYPPGPRPASTTDPSSPVYSTSTTWSKVRTWRNWTFLGLGNMTQDHMVQIQDLEDLDLPWTWQHMTQDHIVQSQDLEDLDLPWC